jgi:hypothetical protein
MGFSLCCRLNFKNHILRHVRLDSEKQILQAQEQLEKEHGDDDGEALDDIDSLDIQVVDEEVIEAMTDQEKEIVGLFQKYLNFQPSTIS